MLAAAQLRSNEGQFAAYNSAGHCVMLAGPGSGKTKTLTIKMARMLAEDVKPPRGIACITYNNQCARELKRRLKTLGVDDGHRASIGTLHGFCLKHIVLPYAQLAKLPKTYPITVASTVETNTIQQEALAQTIGGDHRWERFQRYRRIILDRKSEEWRTKDERAAQVIEAYESILDTKGLIDFDGMVLIGLHLVKENGWVRKALAARFPILVVDEYQDLGHPLDQLVQCLCFEGGMRMLAVGDPDQSIYGFTGAEPRLLRELSERDEVQAVQLRLNYRCGSRIIQASKAALAEDRDFQSDHDEPGVVYMNECPSGLAAQAQSVCDTIIPEALARRDGRKFGDVAILYLDKNDGNIIADAVARKDWQFVRVDGNNPYQPSPVTYWLEDCAAWCAGAWKDGKIRLSELISRWLAFNERLDSPEQHRHARIQLVSFLYNHRAPDAKLYDWLSGFLTHGLQETIDNEPRLRDDKDKVENLLKVTSAEGQLETVTVAFFGGQGGSPDHLTLTTLHSAKGLEYDVVIMVGLEQGRIPNYRNLTGHPLTEERRKFYVGLTRARHEVHLLYSGHYTTFTRRGPWRHDDGRSQFVDEVESSLLGG
ncbi:MAG: ATP-dependent helicase [Planctomycetota bacterium]|nr:ATP-dependent helicase [Planctomycetota bacterium]